MLLCSTLYVAFIFRHLFCSYYRTFFIRTTFFQSNECNFFHYFISHSRLNICMGMNQLKSKSKIPSSESMAKAIKFNKIEKKRENKTMRTLKHWSTSSCYLFFFHLFFFSWNFLVALFDIFSLQKKIEFSSEIN